MVEEREYNVELNIKVSTLIIFDAMERETPITEGDAIENAIGSLFVEKMEHEFANQGFVMAPITGIATERK